jgi:hypothetical protein
VAAVDVVVVTVAVAVASPPEVDVVGSAEVAAAETEVAVVVRLEEAVVELQEAVVRPEEVVVEERVEEPRLSLSPIVTQVFSSLAERKISLSPRT